MGWPKISIEIYLTLLFALVRARGRDDSEIFGAKKQQQQPGGIEKRAVCGGKTVVKIIAPGFATAPPGCCLIPCAPFSHSLSQ